MKQPRINRRQFFKLAAMSAGAIAGAPALGLASIVAAPSREAIASTEEPGVTAINQPTFNPIASKTTYGALTDLSMGWDGTLWGIDAQGAPHIYDPISDAWVAHGGGIDAATLNANPQAETLYLFRGSDVVLVNAGTLQAGAPQPIAQLWPNLPDSFKLGVVGAAASPLSDGLVLFNSGRYVFTDGKAPAGELTDLANWPQTPAWKDGVIDGVFSNLSNDILLLRAGQVLIIDPLNKKVLGTPAPLSSYLNFAAVPAAWSTGVDAIARISGDTLAIFKDTSVYFSQAGGTGSGSRLAYLGSAFTNWPVNWHPVLGHAPSGRDGDLWSVLSSSKGSWIVHHTGDGWQSQPNQADHVSSGQDGTTMIASAQRLWRWNGRVDGTGWDPLSPAGNLIQVSVGYKDAVWARDAGNNVYQFDSTSNNLSLSTKAGQATHIVTTNDGTLWHAKPNNADIHRYLSGPDVLQPGIPVKPGLVSTVQKVAANGFGAAHCLAQDSQGNTQAYRYDSPYVFQTKQSYTPTLPNAFIEQGTGLLYFTVEVQVGGSGTQPVFKWTVVALDAHTGVEVARTPLLNSPIEYGQPVYDPIHNLVYVGTSNALSATDYTTAGQLLALDALTLAVKWSFTTSAGIDAAPSLRGTQLCFGDRTGKLYMLDTTAALSNPANVTPAWTWQIPVDQTQAHFISSPTFVHDKTVGIDLVYMSVWTWTKDDPNPTSATISWAQNTVDNSGYAGFTPLHSASQLATTIRGYLNAPVHGEVNISKNNTPVMSPALIYNCGNAVIAVGAGPTAVTFTLPPGDTVSTAFTYDSDTKALWFGTSGAGRLYALNTDMMPVNHTPFSVPVPSSARIQTTPVLYTDSAGRQSVLFGIYDISEDKKNLMGFDPTNGNVASIPTGNTLPLALSRTAPSGVVYLTGLGFNGIAQAFGIRVDELVQAERDFIIESQLMQDPDESAAGSGSADPNNPIPPSKARYQTHLTIVDDDRNPVPNTPVKIWADQPSTVISIDGKPFTIGPADDAFALTRAGTDGCVVIMSEATNVNAPALRVWASFMDPFERIVVYPDHEWHGRAAQSGNDPNGDVNKPDPSKPNLSTVHNYKGAQLFTTDEKSQGAPANVASAISQMNNGLAPGGAAPAALAGALKTVHATNSSAPYVAYTTLGGMHYAPSNARTQRVATPVAAAGFHLAKPQGGAHTFTPLSHSAARNAIDALEGKPWDPNNPNNAFGAPATLVIQRSDNIFTDFWNWLVGAIETVVEAVESVIVSVAEDIMIGINYVINGVRMVFKAIIKVVDDVVNAIGSFFAQLAKLIEDVIEALSVLFHFGEIMKTQAWLLNEFNTQAGNVKSAINTTLLPSLDTFFQQGEAGIKTFFDGLRAQLSPNQAMNDLQGSGSTAHSAFSAGAGSNKTSHAVQCTSHTQKFKSQLPQASDPSSANLTQIIADDINTFITGFADRLTNDPTLNSVFDQLKTDIANLFKAKSAKDFFATALETLLDMLEAVLVGVLAVSQAFIGGIDAATGKPYGLLSLASGLIDTLMTSINAELDLPFFSWLYQTLFGQPLTFLNVVTLVGAIPVTMFYRVIRDKYPSEDGFVVEFAAQAGGQTAIADNLYAMIQGIFAGVVAIVQGIVRAINDFFGGDFLSDAGGIYLVLAKIPVVVNLLYAFSYFPLIPIQHNNKPSPYVWGGWAIGLTIGLMSGLPLVLPKATWKEIKIPMVWVRSTMAIGWLVMSITAFIEGKNTNLISDLSFARSVVITIQPMMNFLSIFGGAYTPSEQAIAVTVIAIDLVAGVVIAALDIAIAIELPAAEPALKRLYLPWVPQTAATITPIGR